MGDNTVETVNKILYSTFNQDGSRFSIGTDLGFKIFSSSPFKINFERSFEGGIGICEMQNRSNILALVGGGKSPKFSPNKVIVWDDIQSKALSELIFKSLVLNVRLKKDRIIVVCDQKIYVFNLLNFQKIDTIYTYDNTKGLIAISPDAKSTVVAYPEKNQGMVGVKFYDKEFTQFIQAHESSIACMTMNFDGTLLATASDKGTLIRVFNTNTGFLLQEVRRGSEKATIYSLSFNLSSSLIACSSDRGTIHIFTLAGAQKALKEGNPIE
jgi:WD40 repeat protein